MNKIGIYGGSFDPIHIGHLVIAQSFVEQCFLDKCYFVPAKVSPFKTNIPQYFTDEERIKMIELSIANNSKFEIETYEINNPDVSYTINTINYFSQAFPGTELFLLIGSDQAIHFDKWKESSKIKEVTKIVVAKRYNLFGTSIKSLHYKDSFTILNNPLIGISSTIIRDKIEARKSIQYLVADEVWKFIEKEKYG